MRVLLVGDDANDQNLHQKGAPFYIAFIVQVKKRRLAADKPTTPGITFRLVYFPMNRSKGNRHEQGRGRPYLQCERVRGSKERLQVPRFGSTHRHRPSVPL